MYHSIIAISEQGHKHSRVWCNGNVTKVSPTFDTSFDLKLKVKSKTTFFLTSARPFIDNILVAVKKNSLAGVVI